MSDPFRGAPSDKSENLDNLELQDDGDETKSIELEKAETGRGGGAGSSQKQGSDPNLETSLGKLDITFGMTGNPGDKNQFQLKKAEYGPTAIDKPITHFKSLINDFLSNTDSKDNRPLTDEELEQLNKGREALSNATNTQDALSDALHLARVYQHMRYIEEAKKAVDLSLGIDPDNYYGNQLFREMERMHPADIGTSQRPVAADVLTKGNLRKRILNLSGGKVIVLGDLLIDELLEGKPERISREAPVLILEHVDTELIPGGAANTANNIAALGGSCHAIGVCGKDDYAEKMARLFDDAGISHGLVHDSQRPTTVKTRILSSSHSFKQQLLRLDRICHDRIDAGIERELVAKLKEVAGNFAAVILSDYRAGVMTDSLIRACRAVAVEHGLFLIVDAQDDFARFQDVSLLTPNQPDAEKAVGYEIKTKDDLQKAGDDLLMITGAKALLITRGGAGMVLFQQGTPMFELPAFNKSEVYDVTGAGDTVVATMALALVTGSSYVEAMALGNLAAGIVVKKTGTAVTSQKEMIENLDMLKLDE